MNGPESCLPKRLQDLPPRQARFCLDIERFFHESLPAWLPCGAAVLVGFSHGADSTALLLALHYLAPRLGVTVSACHLDHGLRPTSAADATRAAAFCGKLGAPCRTERADVAGLAAALGLGLEEAGRRARYEFFRAVLEETGARLVCLGHNRDDLAEDVLLRLTRGVGWPGLGGMAAADPGRALARPLLMTPRERIEEFLRELGVAWLNDQSNEQLEFARNRVRHGVLPQLTRENPDLGGAVARLWRLARLDADYWDDLAAAFFAEAGQPGPGGLVLCRERLTAAHPALRLRLLKASLDRLGPGESRADTLFELEAAFAEGRLGGVFEFPGGKRARIDAAGVSVYLAADEPA
jgi:tRNA(Ile)-lysidine synthase